MASLLESLPGTSDLFPEDCRQWRLLEEAAHRLFARYGYGELRTPVFERTDVFLRSIGNETDIVQKEMYTFTDRGGRSLTLRPEGTAGAIRALLHQGISQGDERRVYYLGPMFRGERPAAGRKRQFHQVGTECVGKISPEIDVETIHMLLAYLREVGIPADRVSLKLNSRGTLADREPVSQALREHFSPLAASMCEDCQRRLTTNVWRILDCKEPGCQPHLDAAPPTTELLAPASRDYFQRVTAGLDALGIAYRQDPRLVRGLDYYVHTVFEVVFEGIGAQNSIAGGGRYQLSFGGMNCEGVGFAAGLERLLLTRQELALPVPPEPAVDAYLVSLGQAAMRRHLQLAAELRDAGFSVQLDLEGRGMKAQMRSANKLNARMALILGDNELAESVVLAKDMGASTQEPWPLSEVASRLAAGRRPA